MIVGGEGLDVIGYEHVHFQQRAPSFPVEMMKVPGSPHPCSSGCSQTVTLQSY